MRHVEETGSGANMEMLLQNSVPVLNWHLVAGERHHARIEFDMQSMEGRPLKRSVC
jgi:hypothetical protein